MSSGNWGHCLSPVVDHSTRYCSPSLRHVSYPAPQSPLTAVGTAFVFPMKDSHTTPSIDLSVLWCTDVHRNTMEATWKHVKVHLSPYWESEVKCLIYSQGFSISWVFCSRIKCKALCLVYYYPVAPRITFISFNLIFFWFPKNNYKKSMFKKHAVLRSVLFAWLKIFKIFNCP